MGAMDGLGVAEGAKLSVGEERLSEEHGVFIGAICLGI
jgi:hypothetical protein